MWPRSVSRLLHLLYASLGSLSIDWGMMHFQKSTFVPGSTPGGAGDDGLRRTCPNAEIAVTAEVLAILLAGGHLRISEDADPPNPRTQRRRDAQSLLPYGPEPRKSRGGLLVHCVRCHGLEPRVADARTETVSANLGDVLIEVVDRLPGTSSNGMAPSGITDDTMALTKRIPRHEARAPGRCAPRASPRAA